LLAGLVATHAATTVGFWLPSVGLPKLPRHITNGPIRLPDVSLTAPFLTGRIFHDVPADVVSVIACIWTRPWERRRTRGER
jgi:hypothetical protein